MSISGKLNRVFSPPVCAEGSRGRGRADARGPKRKLFFPPSSPWTTCDYTVTCWAMQNIRTM